MCFGGGGGGQSAQRDPTATETALTQAQVNSLTQMTDISMPVLKTSMGNLTTMANDSMDGTLAGRLRGAAGADAATGMSNGLSAATRGLDRFGATMNPNAVAANVTTAGIEGARLRSDAMNKAGVAAEDMKWNRNSSIAGLSSGQGSTAVNGMGSVISGMAADRRAADAADASSAQGLGMMGAYVGSKMFKNGGPVRRYSRGGEVRMASGGMTMFKPPTFSTPIKVSGGGTNRGGMSTMDQVGAVMTPMAASAGAQYVGKEFIQPALKNGIASLKEGLGLTSNRAALAEMAGNTGFSDAATAGANAAAEAASSTAAADTVGAVASDVVGTGVADAAAAAAAEAALAGTAAAGAGAAGAGAAAAAPALAGMGPVGWAVGAGLLLSELFSANGGPVRKDARRGGPIAGPGTATSDSIPARLSDGEYVLNAEAVQMIGKKKLDKMNQAGLRRRAGG